MSAGSEAAGGPVAAHYDEAATVIPELTVLNYGYADDSEPTHVPAGAPEHYCLRLYEHTLAGAEVAGRDVLEVSCGRGGGASWLTRALGPASCVGLDLSEENIRIARARGDGPLFVVGDAHELRFPAGSFDVVVNIEASHLYADRRRFYREVYDVLRPGGWFGYADGRWADDDHVPDLLEAGFTIVEQREITPNVVRALELDRARRAALFDSIADPEQRDAYRNWGGLVGYRAYERLRRRETPYFSYLLRR